jgi:hypothetical protein
MSEVSQLLNALEKGDPKLADDVVKWLKYAQEAKKKK